MTFTPSADGATVASVETVRRAFPALLREHGDRPVAYFDGPGGTQVPHVVSDAMIDYLLYHNANSHWRYPSSQETDAAIARARQWLAWFLGASPTEVSFGANMTTITFHVARALGRAWGPGDEIVTTELDHHANVAPWQAIARERGVTVRRVRFEPGTGELDWTDFERSIGPKTRLVAIGAASNAIGTITDVARAARLAHAAGALAFVDAVHYAPHVLVDVASLECDLLACSAYKFYGPHVGVLYGRHDLLASLDVPKLAPAPDQAPERLETGTQNHEGIVGAARAVEFLASLSAEADERQALVSSFAALHSRGEALVGRLWTGLGAIPGVTCYGPPPGRPRTPTVSFSVAGRDPGDVAEALAGRAVFVSHGDFYAQTVIERLGQAPAGVVRAGCSCYTTTDEIDRLLEGVESIASSPSPSR
jgi:cysteine desulfurase family protein (TIGR01976 family)